MGFTLLGSWIDWNSDCDETIELSVFNQESQLVAGVAFKKTFSYAGFEMQPKKYKNPKIALLNVELELKAEKDNAEIRVHTVEVGSPAGVRRQSTFWMRASFLYVAKG